LKSRMIDKLERDTTYSEALDIINNTTID
jgi:hypothetical protein